MPLANLPMTLAVHGATSSRAISSAIAMCSMSAFAPGFHCDVITGRRVIASKVSGPTNRVAGARHDRHDVVPALLKSAADLDRLVGADAAGHAEGNQDSRQRSIVWTTHGRGSILARIGSASRRLSRPCAAALPLRDRDLLLARLARHRAVAAAGARARRRGRRIRTDSPSVVCSTDDPFSPISPGGPVHGAPTVLNIRHDRSHLTTSLAKRPDDALRGRPHRLHPGAFGDARSPAADRQPRRSRRSRRRIRTSRTRRPRGMPPRAACGSAPRCPCCGRAAAARGSPPRAAARRCRSVSMPRLRTCRAPWTSITSTTSCPAASSASVSAAHVP